MKERDADSIDHIITDPPYLIDFMGKGWDKEDNIAGSVEFWKEALRVCKTGSYALVFGHSRTHHRVMIAMEDAGWEIRDTIMWLYGQGFPKSKSLGDGWGSALKPAYEPIIMARKPFKGSLENNNKTNGLGGLNIDACRVGTEQIKVSPAGGSGIYEGGWKNTKQNTEQQTITGRHPANVILDEEAGKLLDEQSGITKSAKQPTKTRKQGYSKDGYVGGTTRNILPRPAPEYGDKGGASRFFYCPKVSPSERNYGCDELEDKVRNRVNSGGLEKDPKWQPTIQKNNHPTVKPIKLMEYLVKLVSREGQVILDPFAGSGSTGVACINLKRHFILVEKGDDYLNIIKARTENASKKAQTTEEDSCNG